MDRGMKGGGRGRVVGEDGKLAVVRRVKQKAGGIAEL